MFKKISTALFLLFFIINISYSQKVEPPFWWVGMKNSNLQLLVHGDNISELTPKINYKSVEIIDVHRTSNKNYLFIDLKINSDAKAGSFDIEFYNGKKKRNKYSYELKERCYNSSERIGISSKDIIYLLMPDRFANGNTENDNVKGMLEKANRNNPDGRHGGDLQGISNNLDYFNQLGITSVWINPILENNMPNYSYHGYAITDYYKVDARFGSNEDYVNLIAKAHKKNIKIIMDMVFNHCGLNHWWMNDLPSTDWVHQFDKFTRSNYRAEVLSDPYASKMDKKIMSEGWFDHSMPDLNQKNKYLANYLIQNSIWWIEYANIDGIRMDTYPYSDQDFMRNWENRVHQEYPNFNIIGETWLQTEVQTAYFQNEHDITSSTVNSANILTDFPLAYAINSALNEQDSWTGGLSKLYYVLSKDFVYTEPNKLLIFVDNHDIDRFYSTQGKDFAKWKMGMTFLMTTRGIPLIYYGTEYLSDGLKNNGDAQLRKDFLGGWEGDSINVFANENMSKQQMEAMSYLKSLIKLRNENTELQSGKLIQYIPNDGIYVYFRSSKSKAFMIVLNNTDKDKTLKLNYYKESLENFSTIKEFGKDESMKIPPQVQLKAKSATIYELTK